MAGYQLGVIGAGNMAEALLRGAIAANVLPHGAVIASDVSADRRRKIANELRITCTDDNLLPAACPRVVLAVKPQVMPAVLDGIVKCPCQDGCPCCVGKPLRQYASWIYDRGEASVPSKAAARMLLEGLLADGADLDRPDVQCLSDSPQERATRLEQDLRRRLERMRQPKVFHPIAPHVPAGRPPPEAAKDLDRPDVAVRKERLESFHKRLRQRLAQGAPAEGLPADAGRKPPPAGMKSSHGNKPPTHFPARPAVAAETVDSDRPAQPPQPITLGDPLARKVLRRAKQDKPPADTDQPPR